MVGYRRCWVRDYGSVLLGNGMVGFRGGMVLVGNFIGSGETYCKGGLYYWEM